MTHTSTYRIISEHLTGFFDPYNLRRRLQIAQEILEGFEFDTIAFCGMSGAFVGPSLAVALNKQMILVRKPKDNSHSSLKVEGYNGAKRYIIVDDFVSSGATKCYIIDAIRGFAPDANFVGLLPVAHLTSSHIRNYQLS